MSRGQVPFLNLYVRRTLKIDWVPDEACSYRQWEFTVTVTTTPRNRVWTPSSRYWTSSPPSPIAENPEWRDRVSSSSRYMRSIVGTNEQPYGSRYDMIC